MSLNVVRDERRSYKAPAHTNGTLEGTTRQERYIKSITKEILLLTATMAKYCRHCFVHSVLPAPDSPLQSSHSKRKRRGEKRT